MISIRLAIRDTQRAGAHACGVAGDRAFLYEAGRNQVLRFLLRDVFRVDSSEGSYGTECGQFLIAQTIGTVAAPILLPSAATRFTEIRRFLRAVWFPFRMPHGELVFAA